MPPIDVALLTDRRFTAAGAGPADWFLGNILADDFLLQGALARRGLTSQRVDWADPAVDWSRFRCAVFRTTWDYFERFDEFTAWLERAQSRTRLCNGGPLVRWNSDKHYLADLAQRGVPVVPTRFLERGETRTPADVLAETGWDEAVIKPCVSGAARHTYRVTRKTADEFRPILAELLARESMMVQPFQSDIVRTGEDSLMVFGGRYSHAVRKAAKPGDFRVQDDHGGTVRDYRPTDEQIALAEKAIGACAPVQSSPVAPRLVRITPVAERLDYIGPIESSPFAPRPAASGPVAERPDYFGSVPVYGRVDMVRDNGGRLAVMELELIEPELWLRFHPPAAERFAETLLAVHGRFRN